tara:strand:- start:236 stop:385 length:150 start_codon:yes stop_codon:yes gene_type:complete
MMLWMLDCTVMIAASYSVLVVISVLPRFFCAAIWMFIAVFMFASPQNLL